MHPIKPRTKWYRDTYLRSVKWKQIRTDFLRRVGWNCERCYVRRAVIVHHLDYSRVGREQPEDLMALCGPCHDAMHAWPKADNDNHQLKFLFDKLDKKASAS